MNACSPGGSGTKIVQRPFARTRGWLDADHWLKLPATATLVASARIRTNRTPAGVTTGAAGAIVVAHDALERVRAAATAIERTRIATGEYARRARHATRHSAAAPTRLSVGRTSTTAFRDPNPSSL